MKQKRILILLAVSVALIMGFSTPNTGDGKFIEIQGKKEYVVDKGIGEPVVVFISGLGDDLSSFSEVQKNISKLTRTISYDRAGIGKSESLGNARSIDNISNELNELLTKLDSNQHFILVGHSRAGLIMRYFTNKYPEKVAGMVFIDPTSIEILNKKRAVRTDVDRMKYDSINKSTYSDTLNFSKTIRNEYYNFYTTDTILVKGKDIPNNIPVTILASRKYNNEKYNKEDIDLKLELYNSWVKKAPQIKLIVTEKSGHAIQVDEPKLVIKEITSMYNNLKSK
ncbi:MAG TPA: alpha/beta hydrolase [Bacteroidia bacterium]|nr:alpha/beta hydrolase [Bacteroidia bacterium]